MKSMLAADLRRDSQINYKSDRAPANRHSNNAGSATNYVRSFLRVLLATLREIFDENAYQRFLLRTGNVECVQSYREFQREREAGMKNRPKCC